MRQIPRFLFLLIAGFLFVLACTEEEYCTLPTNSQVNVGFYKMQGDTLETFSVYSIRARGNNIDSLLNPGDTSSISKLTLPLSNQSDSCQFIFTMDRVIDTLDINSRVYQTITLTDTLLFIYTRQLTYLSPACGFIYHYKLLDVNYSNNYIDSIIVANSTIAPLDDENHIQILF
jgi:hypothetical protein